MAKPGRDALMVSLMMDRLGGKDRKKLLDLLRKAFPADQKGPTLSKARKR